MKKLKNASISIILLGFILSGCGSNAKTETADTKEKTAEITTEVIETTTEAPKEEKEIKIGEVVSTSNYDFTLNKVELSYDVKPDNPPSFYTHYAADQGKVYLHIDASIKNTGKQNLDSDEVYSVKVDYNDGYTYTGFAVPEKGDGDFSYMTNIDPLETIKLHYLVDCPEEVDTAKENPLFVTITMSDKSEYKYVIR